MGKELFLRMQAAAAAKRKKYSANRNQSHEHIPPLPQWIDKTPLYHVPSNPKTEAPMVDSVIKSDEVTKDRQEMINQRPHFSVHTVQDSNLQSTHTPREKENKQKVAVVAPAIVAPNEGDISTVLTEQSSFSGGPNSSCSRPKPTKLIITNVDESNSKVEEEKNRRLQKFEMIKRRKASEAVEREKARISLCLFLNILSIGLLLSQ